MNEQDIRGKLIDPKLKAYRQYIINQKVYDYKKQF